MLEEGMPELEMGVASSSNDFESMVDVSNLSLAILDDTEELLTGSSGM